MTRLERLEKSAAETRKKREAADKELAETEAQIREEHRKLRDKRRLEVGTLADHAGLLA